jgi:hypothetical protein
MLNMADSVYGETVVNSTYYLSELRYRVREYIKISDDLKEMGYHFILIGQGVEFIYKMYACGILYIGKTKDPFKRFGEHVINSTNSAMAVVSAAIDNMVVPRMEVIDLCEEKCTEVESFWIIDSDCVNTARYKNKYKGFVTNPQNFKCVTARKKLGVEPYHFEKMHGTCLKDLI